MLKDKLTTAYCKFLTGSNSISEAKTQKTFFHLLALCSLLIALFISLALFLATIKTDTNWVTSLQNSLGSYFNTLFDGEIGWSFRERRPMSIMSSLMLVLVGLIAKEIYGIRKSIPNGKMWFWLSIGFCYLALDDFATIHEAIDHQICYLFDLDKHGPADKIDDLIVGLYGLCGLGILLKYFKEALLFRHAWLYFGLAALGTILTVTFDIMGGEGELMLKWFPAHERLALDILDLAEEFSKIYAEVCFVTAFIKVRDVCRSLTK